MGEDTDELALERSEGSRPSRRRALWGALAALAVVGGTLVVASSGEDDGSTPSALPVGLRSAVGGEVASTMAADSSMVAWITYIAGAALPPMGGEATAYRLDAAVDEARVASLAGALGLDGTPERTDDGSWRVTSDAGALEVYEQGGGGWWYGATTDDVGSASGGGSSGCEGGPAVDCFPVTTFPGPDGSGDGDHACSISVDDTGATTEECTASGTDTAPTPPADLPDRDDAERRALDLLAATGLDVDDATVTVDGPYDAWYVTVEPHLDGVPVSGWTASVAVGPEGAILSASGTLARAEDLGGYPLIDTQAAVDRLNEQTGWFGAAEDAVPLPTSEETVTVEQPPTTTTIGDASPPVVCGDPQVDCDDLPSTTTVLDPAACAVQADGRESCESTTIVEPVPPRCPDVVAPADEPVTTFPGTACHEGEPMPLPEPLPEPEPLEVVLTGAEPVLMMMPALDGSPDAYLVPGYRLSSDDGHVVDVLAVVDDLLAAPADTEATEVTVVTEPPRPKPGEAEAGCEVLVEDEGSGSTHTVVPPDCGDVIEPSDPELVHLSEGEEPQVGVPYYVDVTVTTGHCSWISVQLGSQWWWAELSDDELAHWSTPTEGGSMTLLDDGTATFQGDVARTKVATLEPYGPDQPLCA